MHRSLPIVVALLLVGVVPTALASPTSLQIVHPEGALPGDAMVPINVTLTIHDFMCHEPRGFTVYLSANATEGVKATFANTNLTFATEARAYFAEPFTQTQTVGLTIRALQPGNIEMTARLDAAEAGPCFAPDGFQAAATTVMARVDPAAPAPPAPPPEESASPPANETSSPSPTPTAPPSPARSTGPVCSPDGNCGAIGEYAPPEESAENGTPGLGLVGALVAITIGAAVLRRKK